MALLAGLSVGVVLLSFPNITERIQSFFRQTLGNSIQADIPFDGMAFLQSDIERKFEVDASNYSVHFDDIQKNQFLSDILLACNVPYAAIDQTARIAQEVFPVTKLRAGKPYTVLCDSTQRAAFFIYEPNAIDYVVFDLRDSIQVYEAARPVETRLQTASGTIHSSLSLTMEKRGTNPQLSLNLSEIFAWTIDFFRIQKGDQYKVIYEEKYVDNQSVGIGQIRAAYFKHWDGDNYAFGFQQGETEEDWQYFDESGHSVQRAFLKAPLKYSRISSRFSRRRFHPVQKRYKAHLGTDYAAPRGTPILAVGAGTVTKRAYGRGNGRFVKIRHNSIYSTQYLHMSKFAKGIHVGARVRQGQVIGYVGSTGLATGSHLCYRFWKNGRQVDALRVKLPPARPVKPEYEEAYCLFRDSMKLVIDAVELPVELEEAKEDILEETSTP